MANKEKQTKVTRVEIFWLSLFGVIWVTGFVFSILGICAMNITPITENPLYLAQKSFGSLIGLGLVDFRIFGTILLVVGMIGLILTFFYYSNKYDSVKIAKERREKLLSEFLAQNAFTVTKDDKEMEALKEDKVIPAAEETKAKIM